MTTYERLASSPDAEGVTIYDRKFRSPRIKGLYCDGNIAVSNTLETDAEKACVLSEELGHYHTTEGIIIDQSSAANRKQGPANYCCCNLSCIAVSQTKE